jgi:hypothetical protein
VHLLDVSDRGDGMPGPTEAEVKRGECRVFSVLPLPNLGTVFWPCTVAMQPIDSQCSIFCFWFLISDHGARLYCR